MIAGVGIPIAKRHVKADISGAIDRRLREATFSPSAKASPTPQASTLAEGLFDSAAFLKVTINNVAMHLGKPWRDKLFCQLDSLLDVDEWDERDPAPGQGTAKTFIRLLLLLEPQRKPGLAVANDGNLIAAWTEGENRLTIECKPGDQLRWVLSRRIGDNLERVAASGPLRRLPQVLQPYAPEVWFNRAE